MTGNIQCIQAQDVPVSGIEVENCYFENMSTAIKIKHSRDLEISNNHFLQNAMGMQLTEDTLVNIHDNVCNTDSIYPGAQKIHYIYVNSGQDLTIDGEHITGRGGRAINIKTNGLPDYPKNIIINNVTLTRTNGIFLQYADNVQIQGLRLINSVGIQGSSAGNVSLTGFVYENTGPSYKYLYINDNFPGAGLDTATVRISGGILSGPVSIASNYTKRITVRDCDFTNPIDTSQQKPVFWGSANETRSFFDVADCTYTFTHGLGSGKPFLFRTQGTPTRVVNCHIDNSSGENFPYISLSSKVNQERDYFEGCTVRGPVSNLIWSSSAPNSYRIDNCTRIETGAPIYN
jgi:hypothetical protein